MTHFFSTRLDRFLAIGIFCLLFSGMLGHPLQAQSLPNFVEIAKTEKHKVVHISTTTKVQVDSNNPFFEIFPQLPRSKKESALGSGFFFSPDGYVVTNNHVVKGAEKIEVLLDDNRTFPAKVVGADERTDIALLKIDAKEKFAAVKFGDSSKLEIGEWVLAIGNPLGLDQTVTAGIVSAKGRDILGGTAYGQFIQTDAAINFGNSGGPLLNTKGEVVGINTAIAGGQGLGFAIPSNLALKVIEQLRKGGKVVRGWLGVGIQELSPELAASMKLPNGQRGVLITQIFPDSPAQKATIQEQDLIVDINGTPIYRSNDLQNLIAEMAPGTDVKVTVLRGKERLVLSAKVAEFKQEAVADAATPGELGLSLVAIDAKIKKEFNLKVDYGLLVKDIDERSPLSERIQAGDVILKLNGKEMRKTSDFFSTVKGFKDGTTFVLLVHRDGRQMVIPGTK